jgi:hypothetical protein
MSDSKADRERKYARMPTVEEQWLANSFWDAEATLRRTEDSLAEFYDRMLDALRGDALDKGRAQVLLDRMPECAAKASLINRARRKYGDDFLKEAKV